MVCRIRIGWRAGALGLVTMWILWAGVLLDPHEAMAQRADRVVVEGAKREGVVDATLQASLTPRGAAAVQEAIRKTYGVDLTINYTPTRSYPKIQAQALTEHKAGAPPTYDLITGGEAQIFDLAEAGAVERVDWSPLLHPKTPPDIVAFGGAGLVVNTSFVGLLYNPKVISPQEAPSSLRDLANPKWRGKVLVPPYTSTWMTQAIPLGRPASLSIVEGIMKNGAGVAEWPAAVTRFTLGEFPLVALIAETFAHQLKSRGVAVGFRPLDSAYVSQHIVAVRTGARRPNAAKLLAAFLAGPDALKIWQEVASNPNFYYRGQSPAFELGPEWGNVQPWLWTPERLRYKSTPEVEAWEQEIGRLLTGR